MYIGDFGGRSCRVGSGKLGNMDEECGDPGERLLGVPTPDSTGEKCCFPWELGGVVYANEAGKLVAIFDGDTMRDQYSEARGAFWVFVGAMQVSSPNDGSAVIKGKRWLNGHVMVGPELPLHVRLHKIFKLSDLIYDRCDQAGRDRIVHGNGWQRMATGLQPLSGRIDGFKCPCLCLCRKGRRRSNDIIPVRLWEYETIGLGSDRRTAGQRSDWTLGKGGRGAKGEKR